MAIDENALKNPRFVPLRYLHYSIYDGNIWMSSRVSEGIWTSWRAIESIYKQAGGPMSRYLDELLASIYRRACEQSKRYRWIDTDELKGQWVDMDEYPRWIFQKVLFKNPELEMFKNRRFRSKIQNFWPLKIFLAKNSVIIPLKNIFL